MTKPQILYSAIIMIMKLVLEDPPGVKESRGVGHTSCQVMDVLLSIPDMVVQDQDCMRSGEALFQANGFDSQSSDLPGRDDEIMPYQELGTITEEIKDRSNRST